MLRHKVYLERGKTDFVTRETAQPIPSNVHWSLRTSGAEEGSTICIDCGSGNVVTHARTDAAVLPVALK